MVTIPASHFSPWTSRRPCWWCRWYDGVDAIGGVAYCARKGCSRARSQPELGCASFEREPGCDDEPTWSPIAARPTEARGAIAEAPQRSNFPRWAP